MRVKAHALTEWKIESVSILTDFALTPDGIKVRGCKLACMARLSHKGGARNGNGMPMTRNAVYHNTLYFFKPCRKGGSIRFDSGHGSLMNTTRYMAIFSLDNDMRIERYFSHEVRKLIATCKNKIRLTNARKAWIEVYAIVGETTELVCKQKLRPSSIHWQIV